MKKVLFSIAAVAIVATSLTSCKKGENDPALSLKSRKGRLKGEWALSAKEVTHTHTSGGATTTTTTTATATTMTVVTASGGASSTDEYDYTEKWTVEKDGSYTQETVSTLKSSGGTQVPTPVAITTTNKGSWAFLGKSKSADQKKKESIVAYVSESTVTGSGTTLTDKWTGWVNGSVMVIDQLKSKELIVKWDDSESDATDTHTNVGTATYTKS